MWWYVLANAGDLDQTAIFFDKRFARVVASWLSLTHVYQPAPENSK
jgi:hypothetical protein